MSTKTDVFNKIAILLSDLVSTPVDSVQLQSKLTDIWWDETDKRHSLIIMEEVFDIEISDQEADSWITVEHAVTTVTNNLRVSN